MRILPALAVFFVASSCAGGFQGPPPAAQHVRLYEATANGLAVIDGSTHQVVRNLPAGAPSPDWKHVYSITGDTLVDTDPLSGLTNRTLQLPGAYRLPPVTSNGLPGGTSPNGRWLVGESATAGTTLFVTVDTVGMRIAHTTNLSGTFHFDAVSDDGDRLYLIQDLNGREYYVRLFNLLTGTLDENIVVDKSDGGQSMTGLRLSGVATPDGGWLFSMYVRDNDGPFVHGLSLAGPFAFCLDLPGSGYSSNSSEMHWSIAMDRTGDSLFAVNSATGVVAWIDNSQQYNPNVKRTVRLTGGGAARVGPNAAVVSADGRSLVVAGSTGLVWIDTTTLTVRTKALSGWHVWSLALGPDGTNVYAVDDAGRIAELAMSSARVASTFDPGLGRPIALMRVAAA